MEKGKVFYGNIKASKVAQSGKEHICWQKEALLSLWSCLAPKDHIL